MKHLRFLCFNLLQTLLPLLPFPCRTGLIAIGNPGPDSPVILTCNFGLTVERVRRALAGLNAYLLVANSRGVNVWCAATGGLLTHHDVISVLKTSGIKELVNHRRVILPQLAAAGVDGKLVRRKAGWRVAWGPVYAADLPAFLGSGLKKTAAMGTVRFPWPQRLEMAVAWAFPISLAALLLWPFWKAGVLPLVALAWALSLLIFLSFPLYQRRLLVKAKSVGFVFFDHGQLGMILIFWGLFLLGLVGYVLVSGDFSWPLILRWGLSSLVIIAVLGLDLTGSTPVYKSGLHEERLLRITLDEELCKGVGICAEACPAGVFEIDCDRRLALLPHAERCVQCGACIVQCPCDALYFRSPQGEVVAAETVRKLKLNLLGTRTRKIIETEELR